MILDIVGIGLILLCNKVFTSLASIPVNKSSWGMDLNDNDRPDRILLYYIIQIHIIAILMNQNEHDWKQSQS